MSAPNPKILVIFMIPAARDATIEDLEACLTAAGLSPGVCTSEGSVDVCHTLTFRDSSTDFVMRFTTTPFPQVSLLMPEGSAYLGKKLSPFIVSQNVVHDIRIALEQKFGSVVLRVPDPSGMHWVMQ